MAATAATAAAVRRKMRRWFRRFNWSLNRAM
jgi:hypothetical protein